ncbi:uncharacterized protein LOC135366319 [Ornithodoros turicata]|uniref:uncharacterized protein LOC135366319 n=1 Tax=Ornithodoros turicata TaxID=34597 RepID=UPI00313A2CAD
MRPLEGFTEVVAKECSRWGVQENTIFSTFTEKDGKASLLFTFDHIFDQCTTNAEIYEQYCHPIVDSVMRGFNGTIFAYGQTSSGKTHTMFGSGDEPGLVQQTVQNIFSIIENVPDREYLLRISYLEIYKEDLYDLLDEAKNKNLQIRETDGQAFIANLSEVTVSSPEAILSTMKSGEKLRHFGETDMNQRSSRSHTIFRMIIESSIREDNSEGVVTVSHLNLVDLAGSERAEQAGTTGNRFKEGVHINSSLSVLGQVISKLSRGERGHINYRDSKLTRILKNSLGGNAHTAIICNVTPASVEQTLCTLRFASSAKKIQNKPVVNEVISDSAALRRYHKQMQELQEKIKYLEDQGLSKKLQEKNSTIEELQQKVKELREQLVVSTHAAPQKSAHVKSRRHRRETWAAPRRALSLTFLRRDDFSILSPVDERSEARARVASSAMPCEKRPSKSSLPLDCSGISVPDFYGIDKADFERHLSEEEKWKNAEASLELSSSPCPQVCQSTSCHEKIESLEREVAILSKELCELREMTTLERLCCNTSRKRRKTDSYGHHSDNGASPIFAVPSNIARDVTRTRDITRTFCGSVGIDLEQENDTTTETLKYSDTVCLPEKTAAVRAETVDTAVCTDSCSAVEKEHKDFADVSTMTSSAFRGANEGQCQPSCHVESVDVVGVDAAVGTEDLSCHRSETRTAATQTDRTDTAEFSVGVDLRVCSCGKMVAGETLQKVDVSVGTENSAAIPQVEVRDAVTETEAAKTSDRAVTASLRPATRSQATLTDGVDAVQCPVATQTEAAETVDRALTARVEPATCDASTLTDTVDDPKARARDAASETTRITTADASVTARIVPGTNDKGVVTDAIACDDAKETEDRVATTEVARTTPSSTVAATAVPRIRTKASLKEPVSKNPSSESDSDSSITLSNTDDLDASNARYAVHVERFRRKLGEKGGNSAGQPSSAGSTGKGRHPANKDTRHSPEEGGNLLPAMLSVQINELRSLAQNPPLHPRIAVVTESSRSERGIQTDETGVNEPAKFMYRIAQLDEQIRSMKKSHRGREVELQSEIRRLRNGNLDNTVSLPDSQCSSCRRAKHEKARKPMSPGSREEALIMEAAKALSGPSIGDDMVIERLRAQLNHQTMRTKKLERKVSQLTSRRRLTTKDAATSTNANCCKSMDTNLHAAKDAATSPCGKENVASHTTVPSTSSTGSGPAFRRPPLLQNPDDCRVQ